jgi:acyl-CoA thioester hydrolase
MPRQTIVELVVPEAGSGFVGFATYARMLEVAATTASTEAGFPPEWYTAECTVWVIRRSAIECLAEIAPGTAVELRTWVADFRRVRSIREYEGYTSNRLVLRARTDWVYVELPAGKPRRIPEAMMRAFVPEGGETTPRTALLLAAPRAPTATLEWNVPPDDLDRLGHVNNAKYFDYVEAATSALLAAEFRPRRHDVEYIDEARSGDRLRAASWIVASTDGTAGVATEISRADVGTVLTRAESRWALR